MANDVILSLIIEAIQQGAITPTEIIQSIAGSYTVSDGKATKTGGNNDGIISNGQEFSNDRGNG